MEATHVTVDYGSAWRAVGLTGQCICVIKKSRFYEDDFILPEVIRSANRTHST